MKWLGVKQSNTGGPSPTTRSEEPLPPPEPTSITAAGAKKFGLENFGNTCYANSVLQALYFCGPFRELVIQSPDPSASSDLDVAHAPALLAPPLPLHPSAPPLSPAATPQPHSSNRWRPGRQATSDSGALVTLNSPAAAAAASSPTSAVTPGGAPVIGTVIPANPQTLYSALRSLFVHIAQNPGEKGAVAPRAFIDKLKELNEAFRTRAQQDAHEFLNYTLNQITEEMSEARRQASPSTEDLSNSTGTFASPTLPDSTLVSRLFEGILTSETRCLTCESVSSRDETFLDLSVDIEQNSSITACLRQFSASEMLCQRNKFFCDACCDLQEAEKRMKIKKLPNVLALHLKRFKYREDINEFAKLAYRVAFPFELRLFNTVDDAQDMDRLYELFAIVVHIGGGPHQGHYITVVKSGGEWFVFDDLKVEPIKESDIPRYYGEASNGSAYVLYYQAVDIDTAALGIRPTEPVPAAAPVSATVESGHTPSVRSADPILPPGLESDTATTSSASFPDTPSNPDVPRNASTTPPNPPDVNGQSSRSLPRITIPHPTTEPGPFVSTPTSRTPGGNVVQNIRQILQTNKDYKEKERDALPTDGASTSSGDAHKAVAPGENGTRPEKDKGEKQGKEHNRHTWFGKRKSSRQAPNGASSTSQDPPPASPALPPLSATTPPSGHWSRSTSGQGQPRAQTPRAPSASTSTSIAASDSGYDSLPPSQLTPSSLATAGGPPSVPPSPTRARHPAPDTSTLASLSLAQGHNSMAFPAPGHKRSQPVLGVRMPHRRESVDAVLGQRPSTAGAAVGGGGSSTTAANGEGAIPPVPPLPLGTPMSPALRRPATAGTVPSLATTTTDASDEAESGFGTFSSSMTLPMASHAASYESSAPAVTSPTAHHHPPPPPTAFNGAAVMKRASRKLSFTLSLGKKKDKDRHREGADAVTSGAASPVMSARS